MVTHLCQIKSKHVSKVFLPSPLWSVYSAASPFLTFYSGWLPRPTWVILLGPKLPSVVSVFTPILNSLKLYSISKANFSGHILSVNYQKSFHQNSFFLPLWSQNNFFKNISTVPSKSYGKIVVGVFPYIDTVLHRQFLYI